MSEQTNTPIALTDEQIKALAQDPELLRKLFATKSSAITEVRKALTAEEQAEQERIRALRKVVPVEVGQFILKMVKGETPFDSKKLREILRFGSSEIDHLDVYVGIIRGSMTILVGKSARSKKERDAAKKAAKES